MHVFDLNKENIYLITLISRPICKARFIKAWLILNKLQVFKLIMFARRIYKGKKNDIRS